MQNIEKKLKDMLAKKKENLLSNALLRNVAYKEQNPIFSHLTDLYKMEVVKSIDYDDVVEETGKVPEGTGRVSEIGRLFVKNPISKGAV